MLGGDKSSSTLATTLEFVGLALLGRCRGWLLHAPGTARASHLPAQEVPRPLEPSNLQGSSHHGKTSYTHHSSHVPEDTWGMIAIMKVASYECWVTVALSKAQKLYLMKRPFCVLQ
eukprot:4527530-Amphidinium_carterae.2